MNPGLQRFLGRALLASRLAWFPVRAKRGFIAGSWWSLYPWTSYWRGTHEPEIQQALQNIGVRPGWSCWDLGAHFGFYSVGLAHRVGPTGQVAAFEPNPQSFRRLTYHRRLNRLSHLRLFKNAVSDAAGQAELYTYGDLGTTTTHLPYLGETRSGDCAPIAVATVRLDDLVNLGALRAPHLVKIDVEGHGHKALGGMARTVEKHRPVLIVGLHSPEESKGVFDLLQPLGYSVQPVSGPPVFESSWTGGDALFLPNGRG